MTYWTSNWWIEAEKWPRDPHGWIFLGGAVHKLGKGMFEEKWLGLEPMAWLNSGAEALKPFPILSKNATPGQVRFADHILTQLRPDLADGPRPPSTQGSFTPDEWKRVKAVADEDRLVRRNAATRFSQLVHLLAKEAEAGRLVTGFRPEAGGAVRPMTPEWWNTEKLRPRFTMCQMKPTDPFGNGFAGKDYCWIFVDEDTLHRLVAEIKPDKVATTADRRKAVQYLTPLHTEQKPAGVTKANVRQQCMDKLGISDRTFRAAWDSIEKHPSWPKAGRPKSSQ